MFQNWYNFNEDKSINAFAYFTEIFKRGLAKGWNDLIRRKVIMNIKKTYFLIAQMMEMDYTYIMKVQITELVSYDIVSNPSYLSARLYGLYRLY
jgi:hypothetical protein